MAAEKEIKNLLKVSIQKLERYIITEKYCGYDPFDALISPLFKLPILKSNKLIRFFFQQVVKRSPVNIRPLFGIKKYADSVTLALSIIAFTYLTKIFPEKKHIYNPEFEYCLEQLREKMSKNYSGACWGYYFDWEGRYARINSDIPTVVSTGIITNALFHYYNISHDESIKDILISSSDFVMNDLNKSYEGNTFCFSYSPLDNQKVFNATMMGARLLAQVYFLTNDKNLIETAKQTIAFVIKYQNEDGSWSYSANDSRKWIDNFHTAYILDCLQEYIKLSDDTQYKQNLEKGSEYYFKAFFEGGIPKYYNDKIFPVDCTSAGQSIMSSIKFGKKLIAENVASWMINNMQSKQGYFYYRKEKYFTNRISYMRWSDSWMLAAFSMLLYHEV